MSLHTNTASDLRFSRFLDRPVCPKCGDQLLAPEASELLADGRIRHNWACEACGTSFRTAVKLGK